MESQSKEPKTKSSTKSKQKHVYSPKIAERRRALFPSTNNIDYDLNDMTPIAYSQSEDNDKHDQSKENSPDNTNIRTVLFPKESMAIPTSSFYNRKESGNSPIRITKRSSSEPPQVKPIKRNTPSRRSSTFTRKRSRYGEINAGVKHKIRKRKKHEVSKDLLLKAAENIIDNSPLNSYFDKNTSKEQNANLDKEDPVLKHYMKTLNEYNIIPSANGESSNKGVEMQTRMIQPAITPAVINKNPRESIYSKRPLSPSPEGESKRKFFKSSRAKPIISSNIVQQATPSNTCSSNSKLSTASDKISSLQTELDYDMSGLEEEFTDEESPDLTEKVNEILLELEGKENIHDNIVENDASTSRSTDDAIFTQSNNTVENNASTSRSTDDAMFTQSNNIVENNASMSRSINDAIFTQIDNIIENNASTSRSADDAIFTQIDNIELLAEIEKSIPVVLEASNSLLMSPTTQMCDMTSDLAINSPKKVRNLTAVLNGNVPIESTSGSHLFRSAVLKKFNSLSKDQMLLDAGQKRFGVTECGECKFVYHMGDPDDEILHLNYHSGSHTLRFAGWKNERIVDRIEDSKILHIIPSDPKTWLKKMKDLMEIVNRDLGYFDINLSIDDSQIFLYIKGKMIIGCLVAEPQRQAHRMLTDSNGVDLCSEETYPIKCGVSRIWVLPAFRKKKIATSLMNCLKRNFIPGYFMSDADVALSSPTDNGKQFAMRYFGTANFLVYGV